MVTEMMGDKFTEALQWPGLHALPWPTWLAPKRLVRHGMGELCVFS